MVLLKERLEGGGDLGQRLSGRGEIASPFSEKPQRHALITGTLGPVEWHVLLGLFLRQPVL